MRKATVRLLILAREFPPGPGGIGTHAYQLSMNLHRMGWEVCVLVPQDYADENEVCEFNRNQSFEISRLQSRRGTVVEGLSRWWLLSRHFKTQPADVLIASGERMVWLVALAARHRRMPWIAIGHGTEFGSRGWERSLTRWAYQQASAVVCVSQFTARRLAAAGITPRLLRVIPNAADPARFQVLPAEEASLFRKSMGFDGAFLLLTVGNVTERKGQHIVIRALLAVLKHLPNTHYLVAGLPTREDEFKRLARELGVADHVHFLGRIDRETLVRALNACDVFVMTSTTTQDGDCEGYGIAVGEAALCGKPAVVAADCGLAEAVVEGVTGFVVPPNDPQATSKAILALLTAPDLRHQMGEAALRHATAEQTWEPRVCEYNELLRSLVGRSTQSVGAPRATAA